MSKTPEGKVKDEIRAYLRKTGWLVLPLVANKFSVKGSPDHVAFRKGVGIAIESKAGTKQSEKQIEMEELFKKNGTLYILAHSAAEVHEALRRAKII